MSITGKPEKNGNGTGTQSGIWLNGAKAIAEYVGIDYRELQDVVQDEGLPAFKWRGKWRALPDDLQKWSRAIAKRYHCPRPDRGRSRRPGPIA